MTKVCTVCSFFFFQAEDGIRDLTVTGVQTCALPIYPDRGEAVCQCGHSGDWSNHYSNSVVFGDSLCEDGPFDGFEFSPLLSRIKQSKVADVTAEAYGIKQLRITRRPSAELTTDIECP